VDVVQDLMIHDLDLVLHMVQSEIREIRASGAPVLSGKVDIASARIEFANGAVANLTASRISAEKMRKFRWFQHEQYFSLDLGRQTAVCRQVQPADTTAGREIAHQEIPVQSGEPLRQELESFIRAVRGEGPNGCRGEEGLAALEAAHAVLARIAAAG
jgi:predicted dehydrogenase